MSFLLNVARDSEMMEKSSIVDQFQIVGAARKAVPPQGFISPVSTLVA